MVHWYYSRLEVEAAGERRGHVVARDGDARLAGQAVGHMVDDAVPLRHGHVVRAEPEHARRVILPALTHVPGLGLSLLLLLTMLLLMRLVMLLRLLVAVMAVMLLLLLQRSSSVVAVVHHDGFVVAFHGPHEVVHGPVPPAVMAVVVVAARNVRLGHGGARHEQRGHDESRHGVHGVVVLAGVFAVGVVVAQRLRGVVRLCPP